MVARRLAGLALGLTMLVAVVVSQDMAEIAALLRQAGVDVLLVAAWHLLPLAADTLAWVVLLPRGMRPSLALALRLRWICQSINGLLPAAQVGGDLWRVHALRREGYATSEAAAGIAADLTVAVASQVPFTLAGIVLAATAGLAVVPSGDEAMPAFVLASAVVAGGAFLLRDRFATAGKAILRKWPLPDGIASAGAAYRAILSRPWPVAVSLCWRLAGWLLGVGEVWLSFRLIGQPIDLGTAFIIESLLQTVRSAGFFVPAAIGIQEGGIVAVAALFGTGPESALAVAAIRRVRELLVFGPGLLALSLREAGPVVQSDPSRPGTGRSGGPS
jgi:putative membrane protein